MLLQRRWLLWWQDEEVGITSGWQPCPWPLLCTACRCGAGGALRSILHPRLTAVAMPCRVCGHTVRGPIPAAGSRGGVQGHFAAPAGEPPADRCPLGKIAPSNESLNVRWDSHPVQSKQPCCGCALCCCRTAHVSRLWTHNRHEPAAWPLCPAADAEVLLCSDVNVPSTAWLLVQSCL